MVNPAPSPDLAWHYTSAAGLKGIITGNSLRATSAAFMNDAEEMKSGRDALAFLYASRAELLDEASRRHVEQSGLLGDGGRYSNFLLSASLDPDSLTLWRNYGGEEVAYAIGLDRHSTLVPLSQSEQDGHPFPPPGYYDPEWEEHEGGRTNLNSDPDMAFSMGGAWHDVTYISGPEDPIIQSRFDKLIADEKRSRGGLGFPLFVLSNSPTDFMKHVGFADEREVRSVTWVNPDWKFVLHRPSRFGLVPYIELTGRKGKEDFAPVRRLLPIKEITIGPTALREDASRSLRTFLATNGYGHVAVRTSVTPYR